MNTQKTAIFTQIEEAVRDVPGWSPQEQIFALFNLAYASAPLGGDVLELGSWCGRSAVGLGMAARLGGGMAHCVDLFPNKDDWYQNSDRSFSFRVVIDGETITSYNEQTVWEEPFLRDMAPLYEAYPRLLDRFNATIQKSNLQDVVRPHRGNLDHFFRAHPETRLRLAFLDGHHSYDAVCSDIEQVLPHLLPGAWLCFDDAHTSYDGVNRAIQDKVLDSRNFTDAQQLTRKCFVARKV